MNQRKATFAAILFFVALCLSQTASALSEVDWSGLQPSLDYFDLTIKWRAISAALLKSGSTPTHVAQELDKYVAAAKAPAFDRAKASFLKEVLFVQQKSLSELVAAKGHRPSEYEIAARQIETRPLADLLKLSLARAMELKDKWNSEKSDEAKTALFVEPLRALGNDAIHSGNLTNLATHGDEVTASLVNAARYHTLDVADFADAEKSQKVAYQSALEAAKETDSSTNEAFGEALGKLVKVKESETGLAYFVVARGAAADLIRRKVNAQYSYDGIVKFAKAQKTVMWEQNVESHDKTTAPAKVSYGALLVAAFSNEEGHLGSIDVTKAAIPPAKNCAQLEIAKLMPLLRETQNASSETKSGDEVSFLRLDDEPLVNIDNSNFGAYARQAGRFDFWGEDAKHVPVREAASENTLFFADPMPDYTGAIANFNLLMGENGGKRSENYFRPTSMEALAGYARNFGLKQPGRRIMSMVVGGHGCSGAIGVAAGQNYLQAGNAFLAEDVWTNHLIRELNKHAIVVERIALLGCNVGQNVTSDGPHVMHTLAAGLLGRPRISGVTTELNVPASGSPWAAGQRVTIRLKQQYARRKN